MSLDRPYDVRSRGPQGNSLKQASFGTSSKTADGFDGGTGGTLEKEVLAVLAAEKVDKAVGSFLVAAWRGFC